MKRKANEALGDVVGRLRDEPYNASVHVRFLVGPERKPFHAHRWLLENRAEKYAHSLQAGFSESAGNEWQLPEQDSQAFEQFLSYLYTDRCSYLDGGPDKTPMPDLIALWRVAEEALFFKLIDACRSRFKEPSAPLLETAVQRFVVARSEGFAPAEDAAWAEMAMIFRANKLGAALRTDDPKAFVTSNKTSVAAAFAMIETALFGDPDEQPPSDADLIRFNQLFLHDVRLVDPASLVIRAGARLPAVIDSIPTHEMSIPGIANARELNPHFTESHIGTAILRRAQYLRLLASRPRDVSQKTVAASLEFVRLRSIVEWSDGSEPDPACVPSRRSASAYSISSSRSYGLNSHTLLVGDYPSIEFGVTIDWRAATTLACVDFGLMDVAKCPQEAPFVAVLTAQSTHTSVKVGNLLRPRPISRAPTVFNVVVTRASGVAPAPMLASFYMNGALIQEEYFHGEGRLLLPAINVRLLGSGRLQFHCHGTRWPRAIGPFADIAQIPMQPDDNKKREPSPKKEAEEEDNEDEDDEVDNESSSYSESSESSPSSSSLSSDDDS